MRNNEISSQSTETWASQMVTIQCDCLTPSDLLHVTNILFIGSAGKYKSNTAVHVFRNIQRMQQISETVGALSPSHAFLNTIR